MSAVFLILMLDLQSVYTGLVPQWDLMTHICISECLAEDNGLSPAQHQAITCTNDDFLSHEPYEQSQCDLNQNTKNNDFTKTFENICKMEAILLSPVCSV